ncbi:MAG: hypothetical protein R6U64_07030 [Bacteroidales bacterium]
MVDKEMHLRVRASRKEIHKVESMVEKICDDYNVFHSYFGNILFSVSEAFEFAVTQKNDEKQFIDIFFESRPDGLVFKVWLGDHFLEIAALCHQDLEEQIENQDLTIQERSFIMIRMLCDEIHFDAQQELMEMVFYISSINQHLTRERIKLLDEYFSKINVTKSV